MIGRTLEVICHHEKAKGRVLADKIKDLADSGRIPQILASMAGQLRLIRNLAIHADEDSYEVKEKDVPIIHEFVDAILEYLYIAPAKIAQLQKRIDLKFEEDSENDFEDHPF